MGVHVDPAGRHQQAVGVDLAPGRALLAADRGDPAVRDRHVAGEARLAGAIDDGAAANDDVVHGSRSLEIATTMMRPPEGDATARRRKCVNVD